MISEGSTEGDSNRARKAHGRRFENYNISTSQGQEEDSQISFRPQELRGVEAPHEDALVIHATIDNYNVVRIFINTGSSVNIIFKRVFDQMQIDKAALRPMTTSLFRFIGHEVQPLGQISLAISLGEVSLRRIRRTLFTVVETLSAYNVILGRPTLSAFQAVVSTFHQKIKFLIGD